MSDTATAPASAPHAETIPPPNPPLRWRAVSALSRRYPLKSGCAKFALNSKMRALVGPYDGFIWSRGPLGVRILAPSNDYVGRVVYFSGDLDPKITWQCRRLVRPGDTVLDIGANVGLVTMILSRLVGSAGAVHAFEPNPILHRMLDQTIPANGATNVTLHRCALGETPGELTLTVPRGNTGGASLVTNRLPADRVEYTTSVPVKRLPDALGSVGPIRFVKIDVEGFEGEVLRGATDLLRESPPDAILFEVNRYQGRASNHPAFAALMEHGYRFFAIPRTFVRVRPRVMSPDEQIDPLGCDALAVSAQAAGDIAKRIGATGTPPT